MEEENNYTIYIHKNIINNKVYIGITSRDPNIRWANGNGYYNNKHFYNAIKKYGWEDGFVHEIIKNNLSKSDAEILEIELIKKYDATNPLKGYNIDLGGYSAGRHSKETKNKISEMQFKEVYQYDRNGNFIKSFKSTIHAEEELNIPNPDISAVCLKKFKTIHNFIFRYKSDGYLYGEKLPQEEVDYANKNNCYRKVCQYDINGTFLNIYDKISDAAKNVGLNNHSGITACCKQKVKTAGGFVWRYAEDVVVGNNLKIDIKNNNVKYVVQYSTDGKYIKEYKSISDASKETGVQVNSIIKNCKGVYKSAGGFIWKYKDDIKNKDSLTKEEIERTISNNIKSVNQFDLNGNFIGTYKSISDAARSINTTPDQVWDCCNNKSKTCHGYIFKYA